MKASKCQYIGPPRYNFKRADIVAADTALELVTDCFVAGADVKCAEFCFARLARVCRLACAHARTHAGRPLAREFECIHKQRWLFPQAWFRQTRRSIGCQIILYTRECPKRYMIWATQECNSVFGQLFRPVVSHSHLTGQICFFPWGWL